MPSSKWSSFVEQLKHNTPQEGRGDDGDSPDEKSGATFRRGSEEMDKKPDLIFLSEIFLDAFENPASLPIQGYDHRHTTDITAYYQKKTIHHPDSGENNRRTLHTSPGF